MSESEKQTFQMPAQSLNPEGNPRRVGYELEFAGLDLSKATEIVAEALGGQYELLTQAEAKVTVPELGEFIVELDWSLAKKVARERAEEQAEEGQEMSEDVLMQVAMRVAREVVPVEIVCPPVEIGKLSRLDAMIEPLRKAGALGTEESLMYAFGVHLNPEIPSFEATDVLAWLQAFGLAQDWLVKAHRVDVARRITPYIDRWPKEYLKRLFSADGQSVTLDQLIDDYLACNPTRNRALDMLPLFKHLDRERVLSQVEDDRINARPTFHYRLPNCEINEPGWSLANSWNVWCVVETLASDADLREALIDKWHEEQESLIQIGTPAWHFDLDELLKNQSSA